MANLVRHLVRGRFPPHRSDGMARTMSGSVAAGTYAIAVMCQRMYNGMVRLDLRGDNGSGMARVTEKRMKREVRNTVRNCLRRHQQDARTPYMGRRTL